MTMRAKLPETGHSSTFNRHERPILEDIKGATNVRKLKTGRMNWTGPTHRQRLQLRAEEIPGTDKRFYVGLLFTGSGKRHLNVYPMPEVTTEALCQELGAVLERHNVTVNISPTHQMEEVPMQLATNGQQPMPAEDEWVYCELVHDGVQQMKGLEAQEVAIQAQLEAVRCKKQTVKAHTLEALSHALQALPTTR